MRVTTTTRACLLTAGLLAVTGLSWANFPITILHTNDFHARFEPISKYDSSCAPKDNTEGKCFGGSARLATAIAQARQKAPHSILVDGGDQFQGTLFYTYYKGKLAAQMMNQLGYDAMTVGNHEFDDGPEVLSGFVDNVDFPVLMSNADFSREAALVDKIKKSHVIEVSGEKIGLIGLTPQSTDELSSPGPNVSFSDPVAAVQAQVDQLSAQDINKIIVLSHSGYDVDKRVAEQTQGVDVIVGGHSNTYLSNVSDKAKGPYPTMVGDTAIVQAYAYGKFLGELALVFDDSGKLIQAEGEPLIMDNTVAEDPTALTAIAKAAEPLAAIRSQVVAVASQAIDGSRESCRLKECQMGNLVADAMLDSVRDQGIAVAIQNGGGLRASIDSGEITMGEVLTVLPFQNTLATFRTSGANIVTALENGFSQVEEGAGRFPQIAGIQVLWDPAAAPGKRVQSVTVADTNGQFQPIDLSAEYGVVTNNYLRNGGDGYDVFEDGKDAYDYGPGLEQVVSEYLARHSAQPDSSYTPYLDRRISVQ